MITHSVPLSRPQESPSAGTLIVMRHAETANNAAKKLSGQSETPLSSKGVAQAIVAGTLLAGLKVPAPDVVYTSELSRAHRTAQLAMGAYGQAAIDSVRKHTALTARSYGDVEGKTHDELRAQYGEDGLNEIRTGYYYCPPNGESMEAAWNNRLFPFWQSTLIPLLMAGKCVMLVSHEDILRPLNAYLDNGGATVLPAQFAKINNAEPHVFQFDDRLNIVAKYIVKNS